MDNLSLNDLHQFLYTPITVFGYRFLVNLVTFLWMYNGMRYSQVEPIQPYNFIVVGGGTAGSILASRLSENPNFRILLIEAGGSESQLTDVPYIHYLWRESRMDWKMLSEPQETSCLAYENNRCIHSAGRGLGGSSLINGMVYVRGNQQDYNDWQASGARGWSWNDVFPYFLKSENSQNILEQDVYSQYHRSGGPVSVEYQRFDPAFTKPFLAAAKLRGFQLGDYNAREQLRFNRVQSTKYRGKRVSTKKAYLDEARNRNNLDIITFAQVTRVLFNTNKRAIGVEYLKNNRVTRVMAVNEIILAAGALRSPQLLLLSGIGPEEQLNSTGIEMVVELPGVGKNLQDHVYTLVHFVVNGTDTLLPSRVNTPANYASYSLDGKGPLTSTGESGHGFIRTKLAANTTKAPDIQISYSALSPMSFPEDAFWAQTLGFRKYVWDRYFKRYYGQETTTTFVCLLHPKSRGSVSLRTDNPLDDPMVTANYYMHTTDSLVMVEGVKTAVQIGLSHPFARHMPRMFDEHFPGCESFELWSDDYIQCYMKHYTVKADHYAGTCRMGSREDPTSVVDERLNVIGVKGLRVVDASVMPTLPSGNIYAPVIMIAEKAADIIKADYSFAKL